MAQGPGTDDLKFHVSFEEDEGEDRLDDTDSGVDFEDGPYQAAHTVARVTGKVGYAADFYRDGKESLHQINSETEVQGGNFDYCYYVWLNGTYVFGQYGAFGLWDSAGEMSHFLYVTDIGGGEFGFRWFTRNSDNDTNFSVDADTFGEISDSTWYMVYMYYSYTDSEMGISVNAGTIDTVTQDEGNRPGSGVPFVIGDFRDSADGNGWLGPIDQLARFNTASHTQSTIDWMYNSTNGRSYQEILESGASTFIPKIIVIT